MNDAATAALAADLRRALAENGGGEVRFDAGARAAYAADASNYRQVPIGVAIPKTVEGIVAGVAACRAHGAPVLARGGGTSQCGQGVNVAVVFDCSKYLDKVLAVNATAKVARVEPGTVCDTLRNAAEREGLTFGPDPATHSRCTLGGMIANNSCGPHSVMAGKTVENVEALEVLTYDGARFWCGPTSEAELEAIIARGGRQGEIYARLRSLRDRHADLIRARFPKIKRRVSGYNLDQLLPENEFNVARALVGSEGTCALTLQAVTTLVKSPKHRVVAIAGFSDIYEAGDAVPRILPTGPIACEGLDEKIIGGLRARGLRLADIALLPAGNAWLMVEYGAETREAALAQARTLGPALAQDPAIVVQVLEDPALANRIWTIRETGASATALSSPGEGPDPVVGWEDAAVDPLRLGDYLREFQALIDRFGYKTSLYGHFGDGCIHARITFNLRTVEGLAHWREFLAEGARLVVKYGGSLSGEHGDGQAKSEFLPAMYGPELMEAFREFKAIWDPEDRMNPGKLVSAKGRVLRADENLRFGPDYKPVTLATRLRFSDVAGAGFTRAAEHCIGMGKCRSKSGGTMCPSYRATGEERYSTRGRARMLQEMLREGVITEGWESEDLKEALDWCLGCKGCRSDCPTHVDMASYKAEFLSHYHEAHPRGREAFAMGCIGEWAPKAAAVPWLANLVTQTPLLAWLAKAAGGIAQERRLPPFARRTLRAQFDEHVRARRDPAHREGARRGDVVLLWADTFNNHFRPQVGMAAERVLDAAGCRVELPPEGLCCGRPYYDFGMLDRAKASLAKVLDALGPQIEAGTPLVVMEPGCHSVFRDELLKLFPDDPRAQALSRQAVGLGEFLQGRQWRPAARVEGGKALLHGHCHQKALGGTEADAAMLRAAGYEVQAPDTGCCGMAGAFGMKPAHVEASRAIAEQAVLPKVRAAGDATLVVSNGFSCREQIEQLGERETVHLAEALARALR